MALASAGSLFFLLGGIFVGVCGAPVAHAQSMLTGDVAGTVTDPSGAAVVGATVKAASRETGAVATARTSNTGDYRFSLLQPGVYTLTASATGFSAASTTVTVAVGQITTQSIQLTVGSASETIEVSATTQLLQTDTAQLSTSVTLDQLQNIPNPGSDITYAAQGKPGVVMNTGADSSVGSLGYGNFSAFGLPGTSNNFTENGMEVNDPFLNLNNSGPSNMLLGLNDIQETDVVTNAYEVQYGTLAGLQMNSISRSGSDKFHGNLGWSWNGRSMNANDWYNKNPNYNTTPVARPFSNYNQWAGALGGPIWKDKAFFFVNSEGITFITASQSVVYLPSQSYESSVVGTDGTCGDSTSSLYEAGYSSECAFYNKVFALYNGTPNYAHAAPTSTPGQLALSTPSSFNLTEKLITGRVDVNLGPSDKMFGHFKYDHGLQPSYTDPINPAFDAQSDQPDYEGQFAETHTFGTRAVNQLLLTGAWYSAVFVNKDPATELSTFPFDMYWDDGFANDLNNLAEYWPEGRNVTQYQIGDDFSYTAGKHTLKAGFSYKKDDLSDFDLGFFTVPLIYVSQGGYTPPADDTSGYWSGFSGGVSDVGVQQFPTTLSEPLSLYTLGMYFEDDWKPMPKVTVTAGVRVERNSNVSCLKNCLSNFGGSFFSQAAGAPLNSSSGAYNAQIKYNLPTAFNSYQAYMIEPRIGFTYSPDTKNVLRGGFGYFTDVFPGTIADSMLNNAPLNLAFVVQNAGMEVNPSDPSSAQSLMAGANDTFQDCTYNPTSCFKNGGSFDTMSAFNSLFEPPSFTTVAGTLHYPTYQEWNLQIEHEFSQSQSIQVGYVGNRGYHEPNESLGANAYGGPGLPETSPAPSFANVTEVQSEASSNYNGLIVSYLVQGHGLNLQLNYAWSHALDEISNGGILPFNAGSIVEQTNPYNLRQNYGNADYDVPQTISGTYLYQMPYFGGPRIATEGWQIGGAIFFNSGSPFTPYAYIGDFGVGSYGSGYDAIPIAAAPGTPHHCGPSSATTPCLTPADFPNYPIVDGYVTPTVSPFGATDRNQFWGPSYFDTDMTLQKAFKLPHMGDQGRFEVGMTAFNLLNHPNFGLPTAALDSSHFGLSLYAEGPPTSIYGSGVGGDPSVRIVEFTGKFVF
ncbi:MAG: carboxypeptidase regulatory-like domain-containing protein [Terracidiphilus sp.]